MNKFKEGDECYALYVNLTTNYISFKIEVGKFLGKIKNLEETLDSDFFAVEHRDDEVNYIQLEDIHKTEEDAMKTLAKMLNKKVKISNKRRR